MINKLSPFAALITINYAKSIRYETYYETVLNYEMLFFKDENGI